MTWQVIRTQEVKKRLKMSCSKKKSIHKIQRKHTEKRPNLRENKTTDTELCNK